jgi:hypothetical protein
MIATDANALAGYRRAIAVRGQLLIVRRITGDPPGAVTTTDAKVSGIVMDYVAKKELAASLELRRGFDEGGITFGARNVIVLADDLTDAGFALPVAKNDKIVLNADPAQLGNGTAAGDEELNILSVDPWKRGIAGAIDIVAEGV